ncbi:MAG: PHP domain-containing protein [Roseiflexaceae bacterium]|nr:PHP domain-containing protein [Roseiflexaceae bacterium]
MYTYPGAIHMHTVFSDGSGTVDELVHAAREAGLRWIIITDHDTLAGQPFEGWRKDVLVLIEHEITPSRNHFLALNVDQVVNNQLPPQQFVDEVYARGGFGIIAHPDEQVKSDFKDIYRWDDWQIDGPSARDGRPVGIELWNAMSDWAEHLTQRNKFALVLAPQLGFGGPTPATLDWWDRLNMSGRRTFGVGGVDAHAFKRSVPWGELTVLPYKWIFRTLTNYIQLAEPLAANADSARHQVYAAFAAGQLYFLNRRAGECAALIFHAERAGLQYAIGATVALNGQPLTFTADTGIDADVQLIHNGRVRARGLRQLRQSIDRPGVYRLEAHRRGRPWLYTNPIYVVE